jgi:aminopeptidase N
MDWWNELWLNEGFATWVGWLAVDHFYPGESNSTTTHGKL